MPDQITRPFLIDVRMLCVLLSGVVGAALAGCATTSSNVDAVELSRQVAGLRSDLQRLTSEMSQFKESEGRVKAEIPRLWEELQATNELMVKLTARMNEVDARASAKSQAPPPAPPPLPVAPVSEASRALQQAMDTLLKRAQETEQRLNALEGRRDGPPQGKKSEALPQAVATGEGRSELKPGMSQSEVRAKLGEPAYTEETADFVYWFYEAQKYVYFDRKSGKVRGWLGW
jgi:prefoldin subunit 5